MRRQLSLHIPPPTRGKPSLQAERLMQRIERMLTDRRAERLRAQRHRKEATTMIRDLELRDIQEDLTEQLNKTPGNTQERLVINKLLTACLAFARAIDRLEERDTNLSCELTHQMAELREDLTALQARIRS